MGISFWKCPGVFVLGLGCSLLKDHFQMGAALSMFHREKCNGEELLWPTAGQLSLLQLPCYFVTSQHLGFPSLHGIMVVLTNYLYTDKHIYVLEILWVFHYFTKAEVPILASHMANQDVRNWSVESSISSLLHIPKACFDRVINSAVYFNPYSFCHMILWGWDKFLDHH